jgi:hypothetical protein
MRKAAWTRKTAWITAGALALPLALSLPAAAAGLMERAQDEGMRQAQQAGRNHADADQNRHRSTNGAATGAVPSEWNQNRTQPSKSESDETKSLKP